MAAEPVNHPGESTAIRISVYTAFIGGLLTPALETVRRWHQMNDLHYFMNWFDDYLIGAFLCWAAYKTYKAPANGIRYLTTAWGVACGMIFYSFSGQLQRLGDPDPAPVSSAVVALIKGVMFILCLINLILVLNYKPNRPLP